MTTRLYLLATWSMGAVLIAWNLFQLRIEAPDILLFIFLIAGACFSQIFKVEGTTDRSHYAISFVFYAFAFMRLGVPATLLVIILSNFAEWLWHRPPWFISFFNVCCYVIAIQATSLVYTLLNPSGDMQTWGSVVAILVAFLIYNLVNHLMVGIIIWLARGETFSKSGMFDWLPLTVDLTMLVMGASLNYVWNYNPYAILLFAIPLYLIYSTLRVPALQRKVDIDQKTGIYNHEFFMQQFHNELVRANRYDRPLTVLMADLDLLRDINNTYGHLAGDIVIKSVAKIIQQSVREYDIVARFGGEEYGVLMPETSPEVGALRAEAIRKAVQEYDFIIATSDQPIKVTISLGVAGRENAEQSREEILHNADAALYQSKARGRNYTHASLNHNVVPVSKAQDRVNASPDTDQTVEGTDLSSIYKAAHAGFHRADPDHKETE
ncbi:MAG: GGDEF domain-containing protein [Anaerolineaceae bacterium]|nr:GGDEF domain-containing protein [Anaerolineaceae bacterium]